MAQKKSNSETAISTQEYIFKSIDKANNKITCLDNDFNDILFDLDATNKDLLTKIDKTIADGTNQKKDVKIVVTKLQKDNKQTQTVCDIKIQDGQNNDEKSKDNIDYVISGDNEQIICGIAWDFVDQKAVDLDVTVVALDAYSLDMDAAYYNQKNILNNTIMHSGDNKDGIGDGDDEQIKMDLKNIPSNCHSLFFIINAYSGGNFCHAKSAKVTFYTSNKKTLHGYTIPMAKYNQTAMLLGVLYREQRYKKDWYYKKIEKVGRGKNFVESKYLFENELHLMYHPKIIRMRPKDPTKTYELKKSDEYIIHPSVNKVTIGLGWDPAESFKSSIDVDGSVVVFDRLPNSNKIKVEAIVSFSSLSYHDSIQHHGDNLTGKGDGDDEKIDMYLNKMTSDKIDILCVVINIYCGCDSFKDINNCFARLINNNGHELCRFELSDNYKTQAMIMCTINKKNNGCWSLNAVGVGCKGKMAKDSVNDSMKICLEQNKRDDTDEKDMKNDEEINLCIICCEARANMFNDPCGHVTYCTGCSVDVFKENNKCPQCRVKIKFKRIYNAGFSG